MCEPVDRSLFCLTVTLIIAITAVIIIAVVVVVTTRHLNKVEKTLVTRKQNEMLGSDWALAELSPCH